MQLDGNRVNENSCRGARPAGAMRAGGGGEGEVRRVRGTHNPGPEP